MGAGSMYAQGNKSLKISEYVRARKEKNNFVK